MRKRIQFHTCNCSAYSFPHRFGGGRCSGRWVVDETWERNYGRGECSTCNLFDEKEVECQVVVGKERVVHCPAWQDYVSYHEIKWIKALKK